VDLNNQPIINYSVLRPKTANRNTFSDFLDMAEFLAPALRGE
jgi:hypothetical protein